MSTHKIRLFGFLVDSLKNYHLEIPLQTDSDAVLNYLKQTYPQLEGLSYSLAINKKIVHQNHPLNASSELALLPPFAGG